MTEEPEIQPIKVRWPDDANASPDFVNQYLIMQGSPVKFADAMVDEGVIYLMLGHVTPPVILNEEDLHRAQAREEVVVVPRASVMLGRARALEFWHVLGQNLGMIDGNAELKLPTGSSQGEEESA